MTLTLHYTKNTVINPFMTFVKPILLNLTKAKHHNFKAEKIKYTYVNTDETES